MLQHLVQKGCATLYLLTNTSTKSTDPNKVKPYALIQMKTTNSAIMENAACLRTEEWNQENGKILEFSSA